MLCSWQTVPFPGRDGHHPLAELIDPDLASALAGIDDRVDRQLHLLGWFFDHCRAHLDGERVLRYEEIVATRGRALTAITERASALDEPLVSRNSADVYDRTTMRELGRRLQEVDGAWWHYYDRESVGELIEQQP